MSKFLGSDKCIVVESDGSSDCLGFNKATTIPNTDIETYICNLDCFNIVVARKSYNGKIFLIFKNESDYCHYADNMHKTSSFNDILDSAMNIVGRFTVMTFDGTESKEISKFDDIQSANNFIRNLKEYGKLTPFEIKNVYILDTYLDSIVSDDGIDSILTEDAVQSELDEKEKAIDEVVSDIREYNIDCIRYIVELMYGNDMTNAYVIIKDNVGSIESSKYKLAVLSELLGENVPNINYFFNNFNMDSIDDSEYSRHVIYTLIKNLFDFDSVCKIIKSILANMDDVQISNIYKFVKEGSYNI